jgi:molybdopterin-guanine dinucleotide biosynthesis protein A
MNPPWHIPNHENQNSEAGPRAFIQAGGRSSRLGKDKSWVSLNGRPLIEHVLTAARAVTDRVAIIISPANPDAERYHELARQANAQVFADLHNFRGPLGGIYTALTLCARAESALILACDMPFVTPEFLCLLWQKHQSSGAGLTIPLDQRNRPQMLCGVYSGACRDPLARMLAWDELMTDRLRLRVSTRLMTFGEYAHLRGADRLLINLNTPADVQAAQAGRIHLLIP